MEKVTKRTIQKEITEYIVNCPNCPKKIIGSTESQVRFLLKVHKQGSKCQND